MPWPKSNGCGHLHYRKKTANNACNPNFSGVSPNGGQRWAPPPRCGFRLKGSIASSRSLHAALPRWDYTL